MPEWYFHAEDNWRETLSVFTQRVLREGTSVLLPEMDARWCYTEGGKLRVEYGRKALEQLVVRGGAMTRGPGTATHGNNSAGGKSVWNCYCIKVTIVSECEPYVMALDQRNVLYSLNDENLKHCH
jgi:hypothetical protein